jgi:hypothetical protein
MRRTALIHIKAFPSSTFSWQKLPLGAPYAPFPSRMITKPNCERFFPSELNRDGPAELFLEKTGGVMPYEAGVGIMAAALAVVFATFAYLLVQARSLMLLFRPMSEGEIKPGPGARTPSKRKAAIALSLHFFAWGIAGLVWLFLLADIRATAPDTIPLEEKGLVDGQAR